MDRPKLRSLKIYCKTHRKTQTHCKLCRTHWLLFAIPNREGLWLVNIAFKLATIPRASGACPKDCPESDNYLLVGRGRQRRLLSYLLSSYCFQFCIWSAMHAMDIIHHSEASIPWGCNTDHEVHQLHNVNNLKAFILPEQANLYPCARLPTTWKLV